MEITTINLVSQKLLIKKTSLDWFKPAYAQLSEIADLF